MSTERDPIFGCELVTSRLDRDGYGYHGKSRSHIVAWTRAHGPLAEGMEVDHLCRRRNCVALHHLEAVTRSEQEKRKRYAYRLKRKTCAKSHELDALNRMVTPEDGIVCRACNRAATQQGATT